MPDNIHPPPHQLIPQLIRTAAPAKQHEPTPPQLLDPLLALRQHLQRIRHAMKALRIRRPHRVHQMRIRQRQIRIEQHRPLPTHNPAERGREPVVVEQGQRDEGAHARAERVVGQAGAVRLVDGLGQAGAARAVHDERDALLLVDELRAALEPRTRGRTPRVDGLVQLRERGDGVPALAADVLDDGAGEARRRDHLGAGCLLQQRDVSFGGEARRQEEHREAHAREGEERDDVVEV